MPAPTPSRLDYGQTLQGAFDEATGSFRVNATIAASIIAPPGLEVSIQAVDDNIAIRNSTNNNELLINADGSINVNAIVSLAPNSSINLSQIAGTTTAVNNGTANNGTLRVVIASDNNPINVANITNVVSNTATLTNITSSTSSQIVLAANVNRKGFILYNDSLTNCFIAFASTSSSSSFSILLNTKMTYQNEAVMYVGVISAIWDSANGFLRITELT